MTARAFAKCRGAFEALTAGRVVAYTEAEGGAAIVLPHVPWPALHESLRADLARARANLT